MRLLKLAVLILGLWSIGSGVVQGQTAIYGEFNAAKLNATSGWLMGPTLGFYHDNGYGIFSAGFDVRGSLVGRGATQLDSLLVGGRLAVTPHVIPLKPYVEALGGLGHYADNTGNTSNRFQYQFLGGLDLTVLPRVDWRVVEFSYGGVASMSGTFNPEVISTGIVFRLP